MRTTASFDLFPDGPSERAMVRARWLAREGRVADAESAYRGVLRSHPDLKSCWAEYFGLLRGDGRAEEALRLADGALVQFGDAAFPLALKGAALIELARFRDALAVLERAVEADADLALVWHELGYAAFRIGDPNRALLALDRALDAWTTLADALQAPLVPRSGFDTGAVALVAAPVPLADGWHELASAVAGEGTGLAFTLEHPAERPDAAAVDVIGVLTDGGAR